MNRLLKKITAIGIAGFILSSSVFAKTIIAVNLEPLPASYISKIGDDPAKEKTLKQKDNSYSRSEKNREKKRAGESGKNTGSDKNQGKEKPESKTFSQKMI